MLMDDVMMGLMVGDERDITQDLQIVLYNSIRRRILTSQIHNSTSRFSDSKDGWFLQTRACIRKTHRGLPWVLRKTLELTVRNCRETLP
jgi:hypothetical protein